MDLQDYRLKLNEIDAQMIALFKERMETVKGVAEYKAANNIPIFHQGREREILNRVGDAAGEELEDYARTLYSTLMDVSRSYQMKMIAPNRGVLSDRIRNAIAETAPVFPRKGVVACQGTEGAYSQIACDRFFANPKILYVKNFEGVFQAVEQGLCQYGILPIENSLHGTVNAVYDLMKKHRFYIVNSLKLKIDHVLLARPNVKLSEIREIVSHEQALGQCSEFLKQHPEITVTVCENTAVAAKTVSESGRSDLAAIASPSCAALYGLQTVAENLQNNNSNFTRFICISKNMEIYPGANRISMILSLPHTPGSLYQTMAKFSVLGLNLTKLESRPIPGRDFEFLFYFDLEASVMMPSVLALLDEFAGSPDRFTFLGAYQG